MSDPEDTVLPPPIQGYLESLTPDARPPAGAMEAEADRRDFPIVGPRVGRLLMLVARMLQPERIVELGSGFGYSALWFGRGCASAEIHLTDHDEENLEEAREYLAEAPTPGRYRYHAGDALASAADIEGPVDCYFLDIDKDAYPEALGFVEERLEPGGWLIADNVLWDGNVADEGIDDEWTRAVRRFNRRLADPPWETSIVPLRDGVSLSLYRPDSDGT